jgi:hypothetical protein
MQFGIAFACRVSLLIFWTDDANDFDRNPFISKPPNVITPICGQMFIFKSRIKRPTNCTLAGSNPILQKQKCLQLPLLV